MRARLNRAAFNEDFERDERQLAHLSRVKLTTLAMLPPRSKETVKMWFTFTGGRPLKPQERAFIAAIRKFERWSEEVNS